MREEPKEEFKKISDFIPVPAPEINPSWPYVLTEKVIRKSDKAVIKHKVRGLKPSDLSRLHIGGADSHAIYKFKKRFMPIIFELEDVEIEFSLTKQDKKES